MKRIIIELIICILLLSACSVNIDGKATSVAAYEINIAQDNIDYGHHADEYALWSSEKRTEHVRLDASKNVSVECNGKTINGEYKYTIRELFTTYETDCYERDKDWFEVEASSGKLLSAGTYSITSTGDKTEKECYTIAADIASKYINIKEYDLTVSTDGKTIYSFVFKRYVDGVETCAMFSVVITSAGEVVQISRRMNEEMSDALNANVEGINDIIRALCSDNAENAVKDKVREIYKDAGGYSFEIKNRILVLLEDGSFGLVYVIDVNVPDSPGAANNVEDHGENTYRVLILVKKQNV